jgi:hypothetical protein
MAPLMNDEDIASWLQLLSAIEEAEAGRGTARLTEICLSAYAALAAAEFQVTRLRARVHVLTASAPCLHESPMTAAGQRLHPHPADPPPAAFPPWRVNRTREGEQR